jgi:hypothetical protein
MNTFYPPLKKEIKINQFDIKIIEMILFRYVKIAVCLHDIDNNPIEWRYYTIDNEDYTNWADDSYIINYVKQKLRQEYEKTIVTNVVSTIKQKIQENL